MFNTTAVKILGREKQKSTRQPSILIWFDSFFALFILIDIVILTMNSSHFELLLDFFPSFDFLRLSGWPCVSARFRIGNLFVNQFPVKKLNH